ncbi:MAG: hypothetical protein H7319_12050 [Spirosoma sp.]|nr:hypothetical protein [Spirosoma sp.]
MNALKKYLGIVWIGLAGLSGYYGLTALGLPKLVSGKTEDLVFGIIIVIVLMPLIVGGLLTFGIYALRGEYSDEE